MRHIAPETSLALFLLALLVYSFVSLCIGIKGMGGARLNNDKKEIIKELSK
tara:strand:- start:5887 stop:6039 length:153 start_codon:yes stop_codon:yes gene_type:complete